MLGPYQILSPLGAGGMGEVWRATDTRLDRTVALKLLPADFVDDAERLARFTREAKVLAAVSHPGIAGIYGFEAIDGKSVLAMELVEGEGLDRRIGRGALPIDEALDVATQIAEALEAAHEKGIVHRDLKPANVMLTTLGKVKLLDFGLAKEVEPDGQGSTSASLTQSPTLPPDPTRLGVVMGTAAYMAPEQVRAQRIDKRADIWAFGAVLFEMLTGRQLFRSATYQDTLAAVLRQEIDWSALPPDVPGRVRDVLRRCLERDIRRRLRDVGDARIPLEEARDGEVREAKAAGSARGRRWMVLSASLALALALALAAALRTRPAAPAGEVRFTLPPPPGGQMWLDLQESSFAASNDGRRIAYVFIRENGRSELRIRDVSSLSDQPLPGTDGGQRPFFSPDGQSLAFASGGMLRRVLIGSGLPQPVCALPPSSSFEGGVWGAGDEILFGASLGPAARKTVKTPGLYRVRAAGGDPSPLTWLETAEPELSHRWPLALPDGRHVLYQGVKTSGAPGTWTIGGSVYVGTLDGRPPVRVLESSFRVGWVEPGWLLSIDGTALVARRLLLDPPRLVGDPVVVVEAVDLDPTTGNASFATSPSGAILYRAGADPAITQLAWFDRAGKRLDQLGEPSQDVSVSLSPDGTRAAVSSVSGANEHGRLEPPVNVWILDLLRGIRTRLTFHPRNSDENPIWSPDGRSLVFASHEGGTPARILVKDANGSAEAREIKLPLQNPHPIDWSSDGRTLLLQGLGPSSRLGLFSAELAGNQRRVFEDQPPIAAQGQFAPGGRYIAYASNESGQLEVYVRPSGEGEGKWQLSTGGGATPRWRHDGRELFYMDPAGTLWSVPVRLEPSFEAGKPAALFKSPTKPTPPGYYGGAANYDVTADGQRFLVLAVTKPATAPPLNVILGWRPPAPR